MNHNFVFFWIAQWSKIAQICFVWLILYWNKLFNTILVLWSCKIIKFVYEKKRIMMCSSPILIYSDNAKHWTFRLHKLNKTCLTKISNFFFIFVNKRFWNRLAFEFTRTKKMCVSEVVSNYRTKILHYQLIKQIVYHND